jgi:hypothetical protein
VEGCGKNQEWGRVPGVPGEVHSWKSEEPGFQKSLPQAKPAWAATRQLCFGDCASLPQSAFKVAEFLCWRRVGVELGLHTVNSSTLPKLRGSCWNLSVNYF